MTLELFISLAGTVVSLIVTTITFFAKYLKNKKAKAIAENVVEIGNAILPLIRMLINKVILYDDKVEIYYKYTNNLKPDDNNRQAFSFYKGYCDIEIPNRNLSAGYLIHSAIIELFI
ncbi:MAG: hypothetical protein IJV77_02750 [Clostridia bacterium]|nr:hypothetical protein [Clostridia bacterium]